MGVLLGIEGKIHIQKVFEFKVGVHSYIISGELSPQFSLAEVGRQQDQLSFQLVDSLLLNGVQFGIDMVGHILI